MVTGVPVVVAGVTSCQGGRENRLQGQGAQVLKIDRDGEIREMGDAATVLEIIRERGRNGLPLERVYRCLFNLGLYLLANGKVYRNAGPMTAEVVERPQFHDSRAAWETQRSPVTAIADFRDARQRRRGKLLEEAILR